MKLKAVIANATQHIKDAMPFKSAEEKAQAKDRAKAKAAKSGREKLRRGIDKVSRGFARTREEAVDTVRVKMSSHAQYLEELATGKQTYDDEEYHMLALTAKQLDREHKLRYDQDEGCLRRNKQGNIVDTSALSSKGVEGLQAFVMSKDGDLYIGTHEGRYSNVFDTLSHASFLGGRPVEMAGMIKIQGGKITHIEDNSGHYQPEALDMYRGIKALQQKMPGVFASDATIELQGDDITKVSEFMEQMERVQNGKAIHEHLRDERKNEMYRADKNMRRSANRFVIAEDLDSFFAGLNAKQIQGLSEIFANPDVKKIVVGKKDFTVHEVINDIVMEGYGEAMINLAKVVMNSGNEEIIQSFWQQAVASKIITADLTRTRLIEVALNEGSPSAKNHAMKVMGAASAKSGVEEAREDLATAIIVKGSSEKYQEASSSFYNAYRATQLVLQSKDSSDRGLAEGKNNTSVRVAAVVDKSKDSLHR